MMNRYSRSKIIILVCLLGLLILLALAALLLPHLYSQLILKEDSLSMPDSNWQTYTNRFFRITLEYPSHWQSVDGEAHYGEKFSAEDGFFTFTAMDAKGLTLDQAVQAEVQHKLQPYGPDPLIEEIQVQDQEARLILPSVSQMNNLRWQAALLVLYPQPISLTIGDTQHFYPIFVLYGDPAYIRGIAESLQFDVELFEESETIEISGGNLSCLSISEIPMEVCWPAIYSIIQITEQNRRGSFIAYGFHING